MTMLLHPFIFFGSPFCVIFLQILQEKKEVRAYPISRILDGDYQRYMYYYIPRIFRTTLVKMYECGKTSYNIRKEELPIYTITE